MVFTAPSYSWGFCHTVATDRRARLTLARIARRSFREETMFKQALRSVYSKEIESSSPWKPDRRSGPPAFWVGKVIFSLRHSLLGDQEDLM